MHIFHTTLLLKTSQFTTSSVAQLKKEQSIPKREWMQPGPDILRISIVSSNVISSGGAQMGDFQGFILFPLGTDLITPSSVDIWHPRPDPYNINSVSHFLASVVLAQAGIIHFNLQE